MTNETKNVPELRFPEFEREWEERKIGNYIVEIKKYDTQQHSSYSVATSSRRGLFKQAEYFDGNRVFSDKEVLYSVVPPNTITYRHMSDDNIFKFNINSFNESVLVSREYPVFDVNDYADKNFVFYELNNSSNFLKFCIKQKKGGTRTRLYFKVLENYETFYPEKTEQQKIGEFFSKLDRQIELEEQKLEKLKEQKKGYMQKLFSQELRFKDDSGCDYPNWKYNYLGNYMISHDEKTTENNQYPVLTSSREGLFLQKDYFTRDVASKDNTGYNVVPYGYFTYRHMSDDLVFKFNINYIVQKGIVSTLYPVFKTTSDLDNYFLKEILNNGNEFKKYALMQKQGGSRTYMYFSKLKQLKLHIPVLKEQEKISVLLKKLDSLIEKQSYKVELLKERKKGFLQKMFV